MKCNQRGRKKNRCHLTKQGCQTVDLRSSQSHSRYPTSGPETQELKHIILHLKHSFRYTFPFKFPVFSMQQPYQLYKQSSKRGNFVNIIICQSHILVCVRGAIHFPNRYSTVNHQSDFVNKYSVQLLSHVRLFATPRTVACQASLSITNPQSLLKLMSIKSVMPSNRLIFCCPLFLLPLIFPSIRVFTNESVLHIRWPKYWSFSFSISPSNEYSGLISFRIVWFDLLAA